MSLEEKIELVFLQRNQTLVEMQMMMIIEEVIYSPSLSPNRNPDLNPYPSQPQQVYDNIMKLAKFENYMHKNHELN